MKPNSSQVAAEVSALQSIKPRVRRSSAFGDSHHDAIDAQVEVLDCRLSSDKIHDRFEPCGDEAVDQDEGRGENVLSEALRARRWLDGEIVGSLAKEWEELAR